jgi:hypothetical protein
VVWKRGESRKGNNRAGPGQGGSSGLRSAEVGGRWDPGEEAKTQDMYSTCTVR